MEDLRPIFYRLDAIAKTALDNLDVQLAVGDLKQTLIDRGNQIKGISPAAAAAAAAVDPPIPAAPDAPPSRPKLSDSMQPTALYPRDWFNSQANAGRTASEAQLPPMPVPQPQPVMPPNPPRQVAQPTPVAPWTPDPLPPAPAPYQPPPSPHLPPQPSGKSSSLPLIIGLLALLGALGAAAYWFLLMPKPVAIHIKTVPPGAAITVDNQQKCTSDCDLSLPAGKYAIGVKLDGYEPASANVTLDANHVSTPVAVDLTLTPVPQALRIHNELGDATMMLDNEAPTPIKGGEFVREGIAPGHHTVKVAGAGREVKFSFDISPGGLPALSGTVATKNALAVMVSSMGNHGRLATSSGPWKLSLNGIAESEAGPAGVELKAFKSGENELVLGEGAEQRKIKETFSSAPSFNVFLQQAKDAGTLTIATREDNVTVFINDREQPEKTASGQLRVRILGPVKVRVVKAGFEAAAPKMGDIQRDQDVRMLFTLTPKTLPAMAKNAAATEPKLAPGEAPPLIDSTTVPASPNSPVVTAPAAAPPPPAAVASTPAAKAPEPAAVAVTPKPAVPAPAANPMDDFENPGAWRLEDGLWRHRGQGFLAYKMPAQGVFTFEVQMIHGGHVRWAVDYSDARKYTLFELDDETLGVLEVANGKRTSLSKVRHEAHSKDRKWIMQIKVTPEQVMHSIMRDRAWVVLDTRPSSTGGSGKGRFGFLVLGNDEIALSSFKFIPR